VLVVALITSLLFPGALPGSVSRYGDGLGEQFGHVLFANSGAPAAQADFLQAMALLHDFEYPAAAAAFRRAQSTDPGFAMAYWGEAMTFNHPLWAQQDLKGARTALENLAPNAAARRVKAKSDREKAYLDAVELLYGEGSKEERDFRYATAMAKVHENYPDDVDATAFYGLSILGTAHAGRDIATYMRAARVLEEAWIDNREHPGLVHYLIHSYDDPTHAPLGLRAARIYSRIAPDAGHAQHMCSHIFLALGMWQETVQANLAAIAAVDRMRAAQSRSLIRCGHYPSWLEYAYLQLGKVNDARTALSACRSSLDSAAAMDHPGMSMDPDVSLTGSFANMRLRYLLDTDDWRGEIASWPQPKNAGPGVRLDFAFVEVLKEIELGKAADVQQALGEFEAVSREVVSSETRMAMGNTNPSYRLRPGILLLQARALFAEREGDIASSEKLLRDAIVIEETLPIDFGPPTIEKPTHELLGEFLLRRNRKDEARDEFKKALARTPGRRSAEQGFAAASAGAAQQQSP
jgi:tetratricopeptide (TPR) repeat protein